MNKKNINKTHHELASFRLAFNKSSSDSTLSESISKRKIRLSLEASRNDEPPRHCLVSVERSYNKYNKNYQFG